jgi:hypothetical protein
VAQADYFPPSVLLLLLLLLPSAIPAGPAAFVFSTFLEESPADSNYYNSWRLLLQRTADGRIAASWFMDAENIRCAVTSVAVQQWYSAPPDAVSGTCKLFFKVSIITKFEISCSLSAVG